MRVIMTIKSPTDQLSAAERYAIRLANWRLNENAKERRRVRQMWKRLDGGRAADTFADPLQGLTHSERQQLRVVRWFGAKGR